MLTLERVLFLAAAICFLLAALGVASLGPVALVPLGLALLALGFLVP